MIFLIQYLSTTSSLSAIKSSLEFNGHKFLDSTGPLLRFFDFLLRDIFLNQNSYISIKES